MTRDHSFVTVRNTIAVLFRHSVVRYLIIGGMSFLIDIGLLALFYQVFGWQLWLATGSAFLLTFVFNYSLQRAFSFGSDAGHGRTLLRYLVLLGANTLATIGIVWVVDLSAFGWSVGKIAATIITTGWNYFIFRYWVFAGASTTERS
ncbi:GtrA family protein [Cryobacterium sp. PH31-O1]|uniref:GtrA family protein n=1 Tax=Cryobacterium sp. PH31-O1 TaxID=3046306 RepID=UPI0024B93872|nr:GtrA family protein [Cryobacterium sp. PH31-O1]MDJ0337577.1 GtrA family protein [Cryobacterium sp. PH31-O1]